jgi:transcriptional regulator with XRE-family HTH domain
MYHLSNPKDWDGGAQVMSSSISFRRKDATFVPEVRSPTVRRRELGALLRALRLKKSLTVEQAADRLMISMSKLSRMETGQGAASARDVRDLCVLYGVTDGAERDRMMKLAAEGRQRAWWQSYDLGYETYVGLEAEALAISAFQSSVVHGLLQTADYARALHEGAMPRFDPERIESQIEVLLTRQRILTREKSPQLAVVLDEAALHRMVGGRPVMLAQLAKVLELSALPNVDVLVLPFERGAHPALESNFAILGLPDEALDMVFVEGLLGSTYLERAEDLKRYREVFRKLQAIALGPQDTSDLLAKCLHDLNESAK